MRALGVTTLMHLARSASAIPRPLRSGAPDGTYACAARSLRYWSSDRAGHEETLADGDWELDIITDQNLLWERRCGETLHGGLPIEISFRPGGVNQLVAHNRNSSFVIRIELGPQPESLSMVFTALGTNIILSGVCHFKPRGT